MKIDQLKQMKLDLIDVSQGWANDEGPAWETEEAFTLYREYQLLVERHTRKEPDIYEDLEYCPWCKTITQTTITANTPQ